MAKAPLISSPRPDRFEGHAGIQTVNLVARLNRRQFTKPLCPRPVTFDNSQGPELCYISGAKASWGPGGPPTLTLTEVLTTCPRMLVRVLLRCRLRILACDR